MSAADRARLPVFGFVGVLAKRGAVLALASDYFDAGRQAGMLAARVLRGADPAAIPFEHVKTTRLVINPARARQVGLGLPKDLLDRADEVVR